MSSNKKPDKIPRQQQERQPGLESEMTSKPSINGYKAAGKMRGKVALITGGDSGIGRATAVDFAKEGADIAIIYLNEHDDAKETKHLVDETGRRCLLISGDAGDEEFCRKAVDTAVREFGRLDILGTGAPEVVEQTVWDNSHNFFAIG